MPGNVLQAIRKSVGISQSELARRSGLYQANISSIENGITDPGFATVTKYLSELGYRLIPVPTDSQCVAEYSLPISQALAEGKEDRAFRLFIQLNNQLGDLAPEVCLALCIAPPALTGASRYDALIAGLVEYHLTKRNLPLPRWLAESNRKLPSPWTVDEYSTPRDKLEVNTPTSFLKRNILLNETELVSV